MKIQVKDDGHSFSIVLPTRMIFSKTVARIVNCAGRKYVSEEMEKIPPEAMEAIFAELRRVKKQYGSWELVDIQSADGDRVNITL